MLPITLDGAALPAILVGGGACALKRLVTLDAGGIPLRGLFAPDALPEFVTMAGPRLVRRLPDAEDLIGVRLLFVADLSEVENERLAALARSHRILLNVEDVPHLCDFHVPSIVRRGDMTIAVSTSGRSPSLAALLRQHLERLFPAVWTERVRRIGEMRDRLRRDGAPADVIRFASQDLVRREAWFRLPDLDEASVPLRKVG